MKSIKTLSVQTNSVEMRKTYRFLITVFLVSSLFITLINIQSISILPSWLDIGFIILLISSFALFGYGFFLSKKYVTWVKLGRNLFFFLLIISIQLFLTSNAMYTIATSGGKIIEQVDYSQFSTILYLGSAVILAILSFFITSQKLRNVDSRKAFVIGAILAAGIIALIFTALTIIREAAFIHPRTVKTPYQFFIGSVLSLFPTSVLGISILRVKKKE